MKRLFVAAALVIGARADAQRVPGWEVRVADRVEFVPGGSGTIAIAIAVDRGLSVSRDAAVIVDLAPDAGVIVKRRRLGRAEAVDPEADAPRFAVPVRAEAAGDHTVKLRIRFWLCGGKACRPIDVRRTAVVAVTPPPSPDAAVEPPPPDAPPDAARHRTR